MLASTAPRLCAEGLHRPPGKLDRSSDIIRATCRICGAPLMRTRATRRWYEAGEMGRPGL